MRNPRRPVLVDSGEGDAGLTARAPPLAARVLIPVQVDVRLPAVIATGRPADRGGRHSMHRPGRFVALPVAVLTAGIVACSGCRRPDPAQGGRRPAADAPYQAAVEEGLGAAIAVIVDTS